MPCPESLRVQAYGDGEVDALSAIAIEQHLEHCAECRGLRADTEQLGAAIRRAAAGAPTPPELRARILAALDREDRAAHGTPSRQQRRWHFPSLWFGAAGGVGAAAIAATLAFVMLSAPAAPLLEELLNAHQQSLLPSHLIEVVSTDQHTVKPWFAGHADVSPVVADLASQGYQLIGGRADYLERQRAAVVVYQHGSHVINVFSWAGTPRAIPGNTTRDGYHVACWRAGNLDYCAVSDMGWEDLSALVRLLRELSLRVEGNNSGAR